MEATPSTSEAVKKDDVAPVTEEAKPAVSSAAEAKQPAAEVEEFPDPDEDDLDDLDDMLQDFSASKVESNTKKAADTAPGVPPAPTDEMSGEEITKSIEAGLAGLLGELKQSPEKASQFEDMLADMIKQADEAGDLSPLIPRDLKDAILKTPAGTAPEASTAAPGTSTKAPPPPSAAAGPEPAAADADPTLDASFQETIRRTMERMQTSGEQATAAAATGGGDDFMAEMLKQMTSGDFSGEGSEEEFSKMLMGMMEQLTNKEILYEPMKELNDKYPAWFDKHKASTSQEDLKRYEEQKAVVAEIVAKFEERTYSDDNAADREYIVDRMQKMQAAGSPPADLVGDMESAQEAFNATDEQCNPQ